VVSAGRPERLPTHDPTTVGVLQQLEPLQSAWHPLAESSGNVFATWEWISTWWRHFGQDRELAVLTVRRGGELTGIVPLYRWSRRPFSLLRFVGHGSSDELGAICAPADRMAVADGVRRALELMPWSVLLAEHVPPASGWDTMLTGTRLRPQGSPVVHFGDGGWEAYLKARSRNLRGQVGQRRRALEREHRTTFRLVTRRDELPEAMAALFRLHALRWPEGSEFLRQQEFHTEFASTALSRGWLRLWLLDVDGEVVAASYGFRFGGSESYYQAGRDPRYDHRSVGFLLLAHALEQAARDGVGEYRLLRGREPYKYRFATADPNVETVAVGHHRAVASALPLVAAAAGSDGRFATVSRRLAARCLD
jgi:CelD/BcsL family acetyltransferase involved in cellulose biosynthesis